MFRDGNTHDLEKFRASYNNSFIRFLKSLLNFNMCDVQRSYTYKTTMFRFKQEFCKIHI